MAAGNKDWGRSRWGPLADLKQNYLSCFIEPRNSVAEHVFYFWNECPLNQLLLKKGRGGGLLVSDLANCSEDPSLNHTGSLQLLREKAQYIYKGPFSLKLSFKNNGYSEDLNEKQDA